METQNPLTPPPATADMSFRQLVNERRSVRSFLPERIPSDVMQDCFDMAILAPSVSNLQPWQFYWVKSDQKREEMRDLCMRQAAANTAAEFVVCVGRTGLWRKYAKLIIQQMEEAKLDLPKPFDIYYQKIVPISYTLGPLSILGYLRQFLFWAIRVFRPMSHTPKNRSEMRAWAIKSTSLACQNFMLALRAHGYDTCALDGFDPTRIKRMLKLPRDAVIVMVITAGKRAPDDVRFGPRLRLGRENFVFEA